MAYINNNGVIKIADDVLIAIVQTATMEIEGIHSINSTLAGDIIGKLGKKSSFKGINISNDNNRLTININLSIKQNYKIIEVAQNVQNKVKSAIESMTGFEIEKININIVSVEIEKNLDKNES